MTRNPPPLAGRRSRRSPGAPIACAILAAGSFLLCPPASGQSDAVVLRTTDGGAPPDPPRLVVTTSVGGHARVRVDDALLKLSSLNPADPEVGELRYSGTALQFHDGTAWKNVLQAGPAAIQAEGSASATIWVEDSGGGNLLHLRAGAADRLVVDGTGAVTTGKWQGDVVTRAYGGTGLSASGAAGNYLRSDGTNWTSSSIQAGDLPSGSGNYIQNQTAVSQAASFRISGTGELNGSGNPQLYVYSSAIAIEGEGLFGPTRGYLGAQGTADFDGVLSADWAGQELGVVGISTGASSADNYGVLGHSNFWGVRGEYSGDPTNCYARLGGNGYGLEAAGTTWAGYFSGNVKVTAGDYLEWGSAGAQLTDNQGGSLELGGNGGVAGSGTSFIDFHYSGLTQDYNARIINAASNRLDIVTQSSGTVLSVVTNLVGLNTTGPLSDLDIAQTGGAAANQQTGGINLRNGVYHWRIYNSNDYVRFNYSSDSGASYTAKAYVLSSNGSWNQVSDAKVKKNVEPVGDLLPGLRRLKIHSFHYVDATDDAPKTMGVMAQEVAAVFPDLVSGEAGEDLLGVDYSKFGVIAVKAIQEQQEQIAALRTQVEGLIAEMERLKLAQGR